MRKQLSLFVGIKGICLDKEYDGYQPNAIPKHKTAY